MSSVILKCNGKKSAINFVPNNCYAEKLLYSPVYLVFYRIPRCVGLLESVFRAIVNRSRACPPLFWRAGLNSLGRRWLCQE